MILDKTTVTLKDGERLTLRSPRSDEAAALLAYVRKLARESSRYLNNPPEVMDAMTEAAEVGFIDGHSKHPRCFILAAFDASGAVVGGCGTHAAEGAFSSHVAEMGIGALEAYHGRGLGRALATRAIAEAERAGLWNITLRVRTFNERAIRLYESLGFTKVGTVRSAAMLPEGIADEYLYQRLAR